MSDLLRRCNAQLLRYENLSGDIRRVEGIVRNAEESMERISSEKELIERSQIGRAHV